MGLDNQGLPRGLKPDLYCDKKAAISGLKTIKMLYRSTRDTECKKIGFEEAVMEGLAPDCGLYIPESIPRLTNQDLEELSQLDYIGIAIKIFRMFISEKEISDRDLKEIVCKSFKLFRDENITPIKSLGRDYILELFHGPTYAFKDIALQFLGNLFEFFLSRRSNSETLTVLGATSGDTGGAALYGMKGKKNVDVFILHPHNRVSAFQKAQMCTIISQNVHNIAVRGTFDDCQSIVKSAFGDKAFRKKYRLGAVNSINWARIMAQIVYFFHAYFQLFGQNTEKVVNFIVPTGNFGDVLAGYYAKRMGLNIGKLIIATNENDILHRMLTLNDYSIKNVVFTPSPAMDIQISSNFERLLWYVAMEDTNDASSASETVIKWMNDLRIQGSIELSFGMLNSLKRDFLSSRTSNQQIYETISKIYLAHKYALDPHTAVGFDALEKDVIKSELGSKVCLATAHPVKFLPAVLLALKQYGPEYFKQLIGEKSVEEFEKDCFSREGTKLSPIDIPSEFVGIFDREQRLDILDGNERSIMDFISGILDR